MFFLRDGTILRPFMGTKRAQANRTSLRGRHSVLNKTQVSTCQNMSKYVTYSLFLLFNRSPYVICMRNNIYIVSCKDVKDKIYPNTLLPIVRNIWQPFGLIGNISIIRYNNRVCAGCVLSLSPTISANSP